MKATPSPMGMGDHLIGVSSHAFFKRAVPVQKKYTNKGINFFATNATKIAFRAVWYHSMGESHTLQYQQNVQP